MWSLTSFFRKMRSVVQIYCYFNFVSHSFQSGVLWFPVAAWNFPGRAGHFGELRVMRWIMAFKLPEFEGIFEATHRKLAPVPVVWALRKGWDWKRGLWLGICRHSRRSGESCGEKADQFLAQRRPAALLQGSEAPLSAKPQERGQIQESVRCATSNDARVRQKNWQVNCTTFRIFHKNDVRLRIFHTPHSAFSIPPITRPELARQYPASKIESVCGCCRRIMTHPALLHEAPKSRAAPIAS